MNPSPSWIEIGLAEPRLEGIGLVDTPGVGSLDSVLSDLTLRSLGLADALVFVTSCSAPLGQAELQFLKAAAAQVDQVIFAVTKMNVSTLARSCSRRQVTVGGEGPRFAGCPFVGISARWSRQADSAPSSDLEDRLREDVGTSEVVVRTPSDRRPPF